MPILHMRTGPASAVDQGSFRTSITAFLRRLGARGFAVIGLVCFTLALLATLPARAMLGAAGATGAETAVGTIWKGEMAIGDQTAVAWRVDPLRSIARLGLATDIELRGGDTAIEAKGLWWPGTLRLDDVRGLAGAGLVNALIADLPIQCDLSFAVDLDRIVLAGRRSGVQGDLRSGPGRCSAKNGFATEPSAIPAMTGRAVMSGNGSSAWLAPTGQGDGARLAQMTIDRDGKLTATILDAGALILPATAGRMAIETQL